MSPREKRNWDRFYKLAVADFKKVFPDKVNSYFDNGATFLANLAIELLRTTSGDVASSRILQRYRELLRSSH